MKSIPQSRPRRLMAGAAIFLAAVIFAGSSAPSGAMTWPQNQDFASAESSAATGFSRHFWRGTQLSQRSAGDGGTIAAADDAEAMEAYCMDRFKSYDPASGTYLGYDGNEHSCP